MIVIGITGGSGSGKGCFTRLLSDMLRATVIDADQVYHALTDAASPCTLALAEVFGQSILRQDGALNRPALANVVFGDDPAARSRLAQLNQITHAFVRRAFEEQLASYRREKQAVVLLDVPLLFESGFDAFCQYTVGILASREKRLLRIMGRDGIDAGAAQRRLDAQPQDAYYLERCDYAIYNDSELDELQKQAARFAASLNLS